MLWGFQGTSAQPLTNCFFEKLIFNLCSSAPMTQNPMLCAVPVRHAAYSVLFWMTSIASMCDWRSRRNVGWDFQSGQRYPAFLLLFFSFFSVALPGKKHVKTGGLCQNFPRPSKSCRLCCWKQAFTAQSPAFRRERLPVVQLHKKTKKSFLSCRVTVRFWKSKSQNNSEFRGGDEGMAYNTLIYAITRTHRKIKTL